MMFSPYQFAQHPEGTAIHNAWVALGCLRCVMTVGLHVACVGMQKLAQKPMHESEARPRTQPQYTMQGLRSEACDLPLNFEASGA